MAQDTAAEPVDTVDADRLATIRSLEAQLAATPRSLRPHQHAILAYRLGLAYAEHPVGPVEEGLRRALACYDTAAGIFDPRFDPVEHARVLNAAGAAQRALGDVKRAVVMFERAAGLLENHGRDDERAATLNNLGLARTELGASTDAVEVFTQAIDLFDRSTAEGRRGWVATLHNRGLAKAAAGDDPGLTGALADFELAVGELDANEAPYHYGLVHHSTGVVLADLASIRPDDRQRLLDRAADEFAESLTIFVRSGFPYQHALAKYNLGVAVAGIGGIDNLRLALACFEDALAALDTRLHQPQRAQAYARLVQVEEQLAERAPQPGRAGHFAALVAATPDDDRVPLLRDRLLRLLDLPDPQRHAALVELALAGYQLGPERARLLIEAELGVLVELPNQWLEVALRARLEALSRLGEDAEGAARALDEAVGATLGVPQRMFVRDFLYSLGWERP
jgi:tetratricopeptide (TPR) repeat protein